MDSVFLSFSYTYFYTYTENKENLNSFIIPP